MQMMMTQRPLAVPFRFTQVSVSPTSDAFGADVGYYKAHASGSGGGGGGSAFVTGLSLVVHGERGGRGTYTQSHLIFLARGVLSGTQSPSPAGGDPGDSPAFSGSDTATNGESGSSPALRTPAGITALAVGGSAGRAGKISPATNWQTTPLASIYPFEEDIGVGGTSKEQGEPGRLYLEKLA